MTKSNDLRTGFAILSAPALIFTFGMIAFPFGFGLWMSVQSYDFIGQPEFNGFENFQRLWTDPVFWSGMRITIALYLMSLVLQLIIGTYIAVLLHNSKRMSGLVRSVIISPFIMPPVVVGMTALVLLDPSIGAVNYLLNSLGLPGSDWLASPRWVIPTIAMIDTWQWSPYVALIVFGGLQSLPANVYEAAEIDGATRSATFWRITLPLLLPTIATAAILRSVDLLRFFDIIYITTRGGPGNLSTTLNIYGFRMGFQFFEFGYASAMVITLLAVVLGAVLALTRIRASVNW